MLRGTVPADLKHISAHEINLGSNIFTGKIPLLSENVSVFNISSNSLSGSLPSSLKARLLDVLLLSNNQLTGSIPHSICQLSVRRLDLSKNQLTGDLEEMQCWKETDNTSSRPGTNPESQFVSSLVSLVLNNNEFTGEFPQFLQSASQLVFLDLSYNRFFGRLPEWLPGKMPGLQIVRLRSNMFSGHIPKNFTHLDSLRYLDIAHNNISGTIPEDVGNWKIMTVTTPVWEGISFTLEESIDVIMKDQQREYPFRIYNQMVNIDFSCNSLTGHIPEEIHLLIGLTNLNLSRNQFSGAIPNQIGDLKRLESLDLSYNEFSGQIPSSLSALTSLSYLNLSYNNLSGTIPSGPQLQVLDNQIYIYVGNPALCGPPLPKKCSANESQQSAHKNINHMDFLYLGMGIGFVVGLWTVLCTMLMKRNWMIAYFRIIDKIYDKFYVQVAIRWARLMRTNQDDAA